MDALSGHKIEYDDEVKKLITVRATIEEYEGAKHIYSVNREMVPCKE